MDTLAPPDSNTSMRELAKPFDRKSDNTNVVIDTPKGCRNEYGFDFWNQELQVELGVQWRRFFHSAFGSVPGTR